MLTEAVAIGLVIGFLFYERAGFSPGGLVVPGYVALQWGQPLFLATTLGIAVAVYFLVKLVSQYAIVYSRRRFILMVLTGFACQWALDLFFHPRGVSEARTFGYIIPGLIANDFDRQRMVPTLSALLIVSVIVRLLLILLGYSPR